MAEFHPLDEATFKKMKARSRRLSPVPRATEARFDRRRHKVIVSLDTGIEFAFDPRRTHGLADAAPEDLVGVTVEGVGSSLHFPKLDADYTVCRLLEGFLGPLDWTKRQACAAASRENGRLGGRPRRSATV
ncbi:MAG: DUF2442 domain-containing protein [Caulobacteraceae bacterium]|nr:DUF2442 domain-containing protein [Caulobacteraceae bacterium]